MSGINHLAVWVAGIAHFILGAGWYTALSDAWAKGIGRTQAEIMAAQPTAAIPLVIAFVVALVIAYALAWLFRKLGIRSAGGGAVTGAELAFVFIATTLAMNYGFEARPLYLWFINAGYMVAGLAVMGAIIGGWKRKA